MNCDHKDPNRVFLKLLKSNKHSKDYDGDTIPQNSKSKSLRLCYKKIFFFFYVFFSSLQKLESVSFKSLEKKRKKDIMVENAIFFYKVQAMKTFEYR